jgi:hypothetical protein
MSVFDWFRNEPQPPLYHAPVPEADGVECNVAVSAKGISIANRLYWSNSVFTLCNAPGLTQKHLTGSDMDSYDFFLLSCYAPNRRLSTAARNRLVPEGLTREVMLCLRPEIKNEVSPYTLIYRPKIRWRYKKAMKYFSGPHAEADRVYVAAMAPGFRNWQRKTLFGKVKDASAREYFEIKTGVTL